MRRKFLSFILLACLFSMLFNGSTRPLLAGNAAEVEQPFGALGDAWAIWRDASDAEQAVQRAWLLAQVADSYNFHTELEQTTYHAPALTNVGRPAQVGSLYMEGQTDWQNEMLQMTIWQGGSVLQSTDALEVRIADGKTYGRAAGEDWREMDDFTGIFAPNQDPLGYLNGARNLREVASVKPDARQFSFDVDGPALAEYMREQMEAELRRSGKLPANLTLDNSRIYRDMIGAGQLWLTHDGLPLRIEMDIAFPEQSDGSRVKAVIRSDFSNFATLSAAAYRQTGLSAPLAHAAYDATLPPSVSTLAARLLLVDWGALARYCTLTLLVGLMMLALTLLSRQRFVRAALSVIIIAMMVFAPLLDSQQAQAFYQEQATAQQQYTAAQQEQAVADRLLTPTWNPTQDPLAAAEAQATPAPVAPQSLTRTSREHPAGAQAAMAEAAAPDSDNDGVPDANEPVGCVGRPDCDNDTLTDLQETRLGTLLDKADSDGDTLRDDMEVKGFGQTTLTLSGKWYSDPNSVDTNLDGLPDNMECWRDDTFKAITTWPSAVPCDKDSDRDGVPDMVEVDNDNDGIDDIRDLSPYHASPTVYNEATPFKLQVDRLTPGEPLFVDIQLAPTSPDQVSYSRNVLDWPSGDTVGQVQRTNDDTFATGRAAGTFSASDENGDMRLAPMIEVKIPAADAGNLLPKTRTMVTTRSVTGYKEVTTGTGDDAKTETQVWLTAGIEFRADNGNTTLTFTSLTDQNGAALTVDRVKLFAADQCPLSSDATPQYERGATAAAAAWSLSGVALPGLLDGGHVIVLEKGSGAARTTACMPLGDIPNGTLGAGDMFDTDKLDEYSLSLRDVVDANNGARYVAAYLPANVVVGRTGGEKQAFAVRIPYWPATNITSLGQAHEVRLLWMVQLLDDDGNTQIIHTYPNEGWRLAGMSARQDFAMRSAVFYQDPDAADNNDAHTKAIHGRMWSLAQVLGAHFAIDRVNESRLTLQDNLVGALESQYKFPAGSVKMDYREYQTQDEIARVPAEVTPGILARFVSGGAYKSGYDHALLLFAREEEYKGAVWSGEASLSLPEATNTLASYNWKAFRYTDKWEPYPLAAYMDLIRVRIPNILQTANLSVVLNAGVDRADVVDGMTLSNQAYALSMFYGSNQMVRVAGELVETPEEEEDDTADTVGNDVVGATLNFVAGEVAEDLVKAYFPEGRNLPIPHLHKVLGQIFKGKFTEKITLSNGNPGGTRMRADATETSASYALAVASLGLTIAALAGGDEQAGNIMVAVAKTLDVVSGVIGLVKAVKDASEALSGVGDLSQLIKAIGSATNAISKAAQIAAVVGLVISIGVAVGVFIAQWAMGAFSLTDLGFTAALAGMVATIVTAVIMLAISLIPVVGQIIMAVIALVDAVIAGICAISKAAGYDLENPDSDGDGEPDHKVPVVKLPGGSGAELSFCKGISGLVTEAVKFTIFSQNVLVDNMKDEDRLKTSNFILGIVDANQGYQVGNVIKPTVRVDNNIVLIDQPSDWKSLLYAWQLNWDILDNATHRYDLVTEKDDRDVDLGEMEAEWQEMGADGQLTGGHPLGLQEDAPLYMIPTTAQLAAGVSASFDQAGLNVKIPLYLREAYANPTQECFWVPPIPVPPFYLPPVCYIRKDAATNHIDMQLYFDIFPATLDEFYAPAVKDAGYSLAWGQAGEVTFPVMKDLDGDGLLSPAYGGNDPDDRYWDTDGDGMSDPFEMQNGTNPALKDADNDGLSDRQELLRGTNPNQADGDGDGLFDCEETFHEVVARDQYARCGEVGSWGGGWKFVYDLQGVVEQATWVGSDPTQLDGDDDTLTDYQEKLYGLHPLVKSNPSILKLESLVREANAPGLLLRFEERAGARLFGDTSGLLNNATCRGNGCPIAGHEGKYTNGLVFDGVNDQLIGNGSVSLANRSFTVALWAKRADALTTDQFVFSGGADTDNQGLHVGFRNNKFMCAFWYNDLLTSAQYTDLNWHHWACTYDTQTRQRTLYRDGAPVAQDIASAHYQGGGNWYVGSMLPGYGGYFNGMVDEVAIFPAALTPTQLAAVAEARYNPGGAQVAVKPGDALTYNATLENTLLGKQLTGLLWAKTPPAWASPVAPTTYRLAPAQSQTLAGAVTVPGAAASGAYSFTLTAGAAASDPQTPAAGAATLPAYTYPAGPTLYLAFEDTYGAQASGTPLPAFGNGFKNRGINLNPTGETDSHVWMRGKYVANTTDFTFAAWVNFRGGSDWQRVFDFGSDQGNYIYMTPWDKNGAYRFGIRNDWRTEQWVATNNFSFPHNTWVHVAATLSGDTARLYVNGVEKAVQGGVTYNPYEVFDNYNDNNNTLYLGKARFDDPYFNGQMDEVFVYHRALSAVEIQQLALAGVTTVDNFDAGPAMVYLPFDNHYLDYNSYNVFRSPQGNAIPVRVPVHLASPFFGSGVKNAALNLSGAGSYVTLPKNVADTRDFTFAAWVYWRGGRDWQRIFDFGRDSSNYMILSPSGGDKLYFELKVNQVVQSVSSAVLAKNSWVHVAVTLQESTGRLYVNGVQQAMNTNMTFKPNQVYGDNSWLGKSYWGSEPYFNGMLDEVRIYHGALSATDIGGLVREGVTDVHFTFDNTSAPLAYTSNSYAAVRTGAATYDTGMGGGRALVLNGQTVVEANSPAFNMSNTDFTYSVWVKPEANASGVRAIWGQPPTERDWRETNQGLSLLVNNGTDVKFGWGGATAWTTGWQLGKLTKGAWNHIAVSFNARTVAMYVNGAQVFQGAAPTPPAMYTFAVGDTNLCAEFELKNTYTVDEGDACNGRAWDDGTRPPCNEAEYRFHFVDEFGNWREMHYASDADGQEWEPQEWRDWRSRPVFTDRKYTFCGDAQVTVEEVGDWSNDNKSMGPTQWFRIGDAERTGYSNRFDWNNAGQFSSPDIVGDGVVRFYYETHNPTLPFWGLLDDLRMVRRALTEEEIQLLYGAGALPYHFTLDDPPGAGLNTNQFNFKNQGAIANAQAQGTCQPGACPTSGLPGRVNQAVQFVSNQSLQISNLDLPAAPLGFSVWVNPSADGQILRLQTPLAPYDKDRPVLILRYAGQAFCLALQAAYAPANPTACTGASYPAGQWHHLMLSYDAPTWATGYFSMYVTKRVRLYVNGVEAASLERPQPDPSWQAAPCTMSRVWGMWQWICPPLYLWGEGKGDLTLGGGFSGLLDDLRMPYDTNAVSQMRATAPTALLHLEERGAGVTSFANLGGASATCTGSACPQAGVKGKVSQAARFDGLTDSLSIPDSAQLDLNQYTLAVWVKPTSGALHPNAYYRILNKEAPGVVRNYSLFLRGTRQVHISHFTCGGVNQFLESTAVLPLNQYTHVTAVYNGKTIALYINGVFNQAQPVTAPGCQNNAPLLIGGLGGELDEIQVYNYALYAYQIKNLYEMQANWIEEENSYDIVVDADVPTSSLAGTLPNPTSYYPHADKQLGVRAEDPTTGVSLLELGVSRNGGAVTWMASEACQDASGGTAEGSPAWCPWFKPTTLGGEGRYTVQTRATDAVGNRETPAAARTILVDATGPSLTAAQANGSTQALQPHPTQANAQVLRLGGAVSDPALSSGDAGSGVNEVWVTLRNAAGALVGDAPYPATLNGATWTLDYPFLQAQVAGPYYLDVTASDAMGNATALATRTLYLDGTAPGVELDESASGLPTGSNRTYVKGTTTLRGIISERPFPQGALVAYHFEESAGAPSFANAAASSGWTNPGHATCAGASCPTAGGAGRAGRGLTFDGTDDQVMIADSPELRLNRFTISLWVNPAQTKSNWQPLLMKTSADGLSRNYGILIVPNSTKIHYTAQLANCSTIILGYSETPLPLNAWSHVALTYDGVDMKLYINGVWNLTTPVNGGLCQAPNAIRIGRVENVWQGFRGMLDEVAVYDSVLSADEIRVLAAPNVNGLQSAAVSFTPLWADETSGATSPYLTTGMTGQTFNLPLDDPRGQNQNTVYRNWANPTATGSCSSVTCPESGARSPAGGAADFDGKDDYINLPQSATQAQDFTFAAWVYWRGGAIWQRIFDFGQDTAYNMFLTPYGGAGTLRFAIKNGGAEQILDTARLAANTWVHVAVTLQGDTGKVYVNGVERASGAITIDPSQISGLRNYLGKSQYPDPYFNGMVSDVRIFARGLSATELQSLWRGSRAVLALPLDERFITDGDMLPDASGWKQTATLTTGAGDAANKAVAGHIGPYALYLDGVDDHIVGQALPSLVNTSFTVAFWAMRSNTATTDQFIFSSGTNANNQGLHLGFRNNTFMCAFWYNDLVTPAPYADTAWHHWACVYDAQTRQRTIYRDGVPVAQDIASAHYQGSGSWYVGSMLPGYGGYFNGAVDDVRVYPRSLAVAEVADLVNAGWRTVVVSGEQANWSLPVPAGLEGVYRLDLRGRDNGNHLSFNSQKAALNQAIDSLAPRATLTRRSGGTWNNQYTYVFAAQDLYLSQTGLSTPCGSNGETVQIMRLDAATGQRLLSGLEVKCTLPQPAANESATVCDTAGNCATLNATLAAAPAPLWTYPEGGRSVLARDMIPLNPNEALAVVDQPVSLWPPSKQKPAPVKAPTAGEFCAATPDEGATVFTGTTASAVRQALGAALPGGTVKVAGTCVGAILQEGVTQVALITQTLTLAGGYTTTNWTTAYPLTQPTTLDALGGGRVIYASAAATLTSLTLQNGATGESGGGAYFYYVPAVISGVTFISNTATYFGGGAALFDAATISNTSFINNSSSDYWGGGLYVLGAADVRRSTFTGNTTAYDGGGADFAGAATVVDTVFSGNSAGQYGGGATFAGIATVSGVTFTDNTALSAGGGAYFTDASAKQLDNGLFARNQSPYSGAAIYVGDAAPLSLIHTTMVSPSLVANAAIAVDSGTVYLTNTIVTSHTTGVNNLAGSVTAWNPLFFGNTYDTSGAVTVNDAIIGDPAFVNPAADDYHLTAVSPAINAGVTPTPDVTGDGDGEARPQQGGYDIGYDETPFNTPPVITPSAGAGGSINPATPQRIAYGSDIAFTITPDANYHILDVAVDGASVGTPDVYTFTNATADHTIAAFFDMDTFVITPTAGVGGAITPATPQTVIYGNDIAFTITPNVGYGILAVAVDGASVGTPDVYTFTNVTADHTITAAFAIAAFVITPTAGAGGAITPATPQTVIYGGDITFTITPDTAYDIADVGVDGVLQGAVSSYTFVNVQADHTITATFTASPIITPGTLEFLDLPGVMTALTPVKLKGRVAPPNSLIHLVVSLDQTPIFSETYPAGTVFSRLFSVDWTPPQEGSYLLTAQATDELSGTATISASLFVDSSHPEAIQDTSVYTLAAYSPAMGLVFTGVASDTTGIISATAQLDLGGDPIPLGVVLDENVAPVGYLDGQAVYTHTAWSAAWWTLDNLPDNGAGTLALTLYDTNGAPVTHTFPVILDVTPPKRNIAILANGAPITAGFTYTGSPLVTTVAITGVSDGAAVSLWYGWTESYTAILSDLTPAAAPNDPFTVTQDFTRTVADGGVARFFHLYMADSFGNARAEVFGPYYHDLPGMPDYISTPPLGDAFTAGVYRAWQTNGCALLGEDQRISDRGLQDAPALSGNQSLYLTWNTDRLHFVWQGADWSTDGDLFIYLDTLPDEAGPYRQVGGGAAYNPYTSTYSNTILLLPTQEWSNNPAFNPPAGAPAVDGMHADYALWVTDSETAYLLRWDGSQWVISGTLDALGGAYTLDTTVAGAFTDLSVPFSLVGNPQNWATPFPGLGPEGMGVVAFAVDAEEGPGGGLRVWSILPYANPADSARVVPGAPPVGEPHKVMLTDRYIAPVVAGACFAPEAGMEVFMTAAVDRFTYNRFEDALRLVVPESSVNPDAWDDLFAPYDDVYQDWLAADYCPEHPAYAECRAAKPPAALDDAGLLAAVMDSQHPPLLPGDTVTYTLYYLNPADAPTTVPAYLYTNGNLNAPLDGVAFAGQSWPDGCPGWLTLDLHAGAGRQVFTGTVQANGVQTVTLDIAPSYSLGAACALVAGDGSWPAYRLNVRHTPDDGAPVYIAILPDFTTTGIVSATIPGVVRDAAPVSQIEIEATSQAHGAITFACTDPTPDDGRWECLWDIPATYGGSTPDNGVEFTLRARATDAFGNLSDWSWPQTVLVDTQAAQFAVGDAPISGTLRMRTPQAMAAPTPLSDEVIRLSGVISDNTVPQSIELCRTDAEGCVTVAARLNPFSVPPTTYSYADVLTTPLAIDATVCGAGAVGLVRTFAITDSFTIGGLQAGLRLAHPYRSDMSARLQSPAGTEVTLFSFTQNVLLENVNALFSDRASDSLPDELFGHDLDADYTAHTYRPQERLASFNGEDAEGTWTLTLCDRDPANDVGAFYAAALYFDAVAPPLNVSGDWEYTFDASYSDGALYTWQLFAADVHGNRTAQPYSLTVWVDNVAPVITATQTVTRLLIPNAAQVLSGVVSDGDVVSATWVFITDPLGNAWIERTQGDPAAWTYTFTPTVGGRYDFTVYAVDRAGNQAGVQMFPIDVLQPLEIVQTVAPDYDVQAGAIVTYMLWVYNYNAAEAAEAVVISSTLNPWLTPVNTAGASYADNVLAWPPMTLAAGGSLSLTVSAQMPDSFFITTTTRVTETQTFSDTPPITVTYLVTDWVDLRGTFFTSQASLSAANLGPSEAPQTSFRAAGAPEVTPMSLVEISKQVTPTLDLLPGSVVSYTLYITNATNITAENVIISDTLNLALTPEDIGSAAYNSANRTLTWPAQTLRPGQSLTYIFSARLSDDQTVLNALFGYVDNQAMVTSTLGSGVSNLAVLRTRVVQRIYLPLAINQRLPKPQPITEPIPAIPSQVITTPGITYYTRTLLLNAPIPDGGYFYFSSSDTSVQPVWVDDVLVLLHQETTIYSRTASVAVLMPVPRDVVETIATGEVTLEYRDVHGVSIGADTVWLVWSQEEVGP